MYNLKIDNLQLGEENDRGLKVSIKNKYLFRINIVRLQK